MCFYSNLNVKERNSRLWKAICEVTYPTYEAASLRFDDEQEEGNNSNNSNRSDKNVDTSCNS